ncbi:hypothetical protein [Streptomyces sp. NRRL WC-3742]|uniref:hypothetical protein n=1 Tax=Streptomyces sp. NRRL WC-3742 TaxID=1463934 RepID=UPI0007C5D88C|nr:hypothetical protein [Streptomyces sp. NRRL WC-3742]
MAFPRGLRRRCERRLAGVHLPDPFTLEGFRTSLEHSRGRPIVLEPLPVLGADLPCGLWIALPDIDLIYFEARTSPAHQDLIKLHELSHVLCGHSGSLELSRLGTLLPDLAPELVAEILGAGRTGYETADEQEAEMTALLLTALVAPAAGLDPVSDRLTASLAYPDRPRRWRKNP